MPQKLNRYFDNATTSYPKPEEMKRVLAHFYDVPVGSYGRSADEATLSITLKVEELRDRLAAWLDVSEASHILFCENATFGLNAILKGYKPLRKPGSIVWISPMEHNAVMRPLTALCAGNGISYRIMPHLPDGTIDTARLAEEWPGSQTALACINLESNVNGMMQPIESIANELHRLGVPILCDATQLPGTERIEADRLGIDFVAFTGHKGLLGPSGTGGYFIRHPESVEPLTAGGNGVHSESMDITVEMPDRFMAGTPNMLGLVALAESVAHLPAYGITQEQWCDALDEMAEMEGLTVWRSADRKRQGYVCSLTHETLLPSETGDLLLHRHGLITRTGLHCAPLAHRTLGTDKTGTVRISLSPYHTSQDLQLLLTGLRDVLHSR